MNSENDHEREEETIQDEKMNAVPDDAQDEEKNTLPDDAQDEEAKDEEEFRADDAIEADDAVAADDAAEPELSGEDAPIRKKGRKRRILTLSLAGVVATILIGVYIFANYMLNRINYENDSDVYRAPTDLTVNAKSVKRIRNGGEEEFVDDRKKNLFNILLIGEEVDRSEKRGRSDACILLSVNKKKKTIKMISFLRDCYVEIPGYLNNKLNMAYKNGGGPLLSETLEENFDVKVDGYVRVDYADFEEIIDRLGGVEITLSEDEAKYLNTTNYISKRKYRNVKKGEQTLNGNQALGYCRIRKLPTADGVYYDWGRTARQRKVLEQIYMKYKAKNAVELISLMKDVLSLATTNMKRSDLIYLLRLVLSLKIGEVETLAIPVNNGYSNLDLPERNLGDLLELDFERNNKEIKDFIECKGKYAKEEAKEE